MEKNKNIVEINLIETVDFVLLCISYNLTIFSKSPAARVSYGAMPRKPM